ncbi:MAG: hypothetical protein QM820_53400 [Minicystis sp.]
MSMLRSLVRTTVGIGLGLVAVAAGCTAADDDETTGVAQIAITQVPFDGSVGCIAVTATGATTVTRKTDVTPGSGSILTLSGLPTGTVSFTGNAYAGPCAQVSPASVPTWVSDPVLAMISHQPVLVTLSMRRNGQATVGVDFDDPSCRSNGAPCFSPTECCSNICANNTCQDQGSCQPQGGNCMVDTDCCSGGCNGGFCGCPPGFVSCGSACTDFQFDPQNCGACGNICPSGSVCVWGGCLFMGPSCADGFKDGFETGIDCGGGQCSPCADFQGCATASDCVSSVCIGGQCAPPACNDAVRNGTETDVDCGGVSCVPCAPGKMCLAGVDCVSGICANGLCQ